MTVLRAHFDGKVLVPDEPVDLPTGKSLELQVREIEPNTHPKTGLPIFPVPPDARPIRSEDIQRALDDEL